MAIALLFLLLVLVLFGVGIAYAVYSVLGRRAAPSGVSPLRELSGLEAAA